MWIQKSIQLSAKPRGFHLITNEVLQQLPELQEVSIGILHIFIQHTSASLSLNENASPDVRRDMEKHFNVLVPEDVDYFEHTYEGSDDMPAHIKASLLGFSVSIPVTNGKLALGTWQGIYLCEHRNHGGQRKLILTLQGA